MRSTFKKYASILIRFGEHGLGDFLNELGNAIPLAFRLEGFVTELQDAAISIWRAG